MAETMTSSDLDTLVQEVGRLLKKRDLMLVTAESCTGGWVAERITSIAGSSDWFERGFIAYTNIAKREMLDVKTAILSRYGAVSEQAARAMAEGALARSHAQVALAITGLAGPGGGTTEKPVGTVYFAWAGKKRDSTSRKEVFTGDRQSVRRQSVAAALQGLLDFLS